MTITPATTSILAEMTEAQSDIEMMIGIGLNKESDAVFFQYLGDEQTPSALMLPSGKPLTRLANVKLNGLSIADNVGSFKQTKLNIYLESSQGRIVLLTSGLNTLWSQFFICGLSGLQQEYALDAPFTLDSWKGTSAMRPCFSAIRASGNKVTDMMLKDQLQEARSDGNSKRVLSIMRDTVGLLSQAIGGPDVAPVEVAVENAADDLPF